MSDEEVQTKAPVKRGRKPNPEKAVVKKEVEKNADDEDAPPVKRGRGRPQKAAPKKAAAAKSNGVATMEPSWTLEHRIFVYDCFVRSGESVTAVQREFRRRFDINRNDSVPARDTILRWVNNLRTGGSIMKTKPPGPQRTVRTPENIERVRQAIQRSPLRSARKHSTALQISDRTLRRILHGELDVSQM